MFGGGITISQKQNSGTQSVVFQSPKIQLTPMQRVRIIEMLTPDDKSEILMNAGLPPGSASTIALQGPASFWSALDNQLASGRSDIWGNRPAIRNIIHSSPSSVPAAAEPTSSLAAALTEAESKKTIGYFVANQNSSRTAKTFYGDFCREMDLSGAWRRLLKKFDILSTPAVQTLADDLLRRWDADEPVSPTDTIMKELCKTSSFATRTLESLLQAVNEIAVGADGGMKCPALIATTENIHMLSTAADLGVQASTEGYLQNEIRAVLLDKEIADKSNVAALVEALKKNGYTRARDLRDHPLNQVEWEEIGLVRLKAKAAMKAFV